MLRSNENQQLKKHVSLPACQSVIFYTRMPRLLKRWLFVSGSASWSTTPARQRSLEVRRRMGSGGSRGLQTRSELPKGGLGANDTNTPPPFFQITSQPPAPDLPDELLNPFTRQPRSVLIKLRFFDDAGRELLILPI